MLVIYFICAEISAYALILLILITFCRTSSTLRIKSQQIITKAASDQTSSHLPQAPSYKKHHLTIEIPSDTIEPDENSEFINNYCKYQCFPFLLCNDPKSQITKIERLTIWFTLLVLETLVAALIDFEDPVIVSSGISCLICSPATFLLNVVFGACLPKADKFEIRQAAGYVVCWSFMVVAAGVATEVEVEDFQLFVMCCFLIVFIEFAVMEPLRTLIKAIGYLIFKDNGLMPRLCENI